MKFSIVTPTLNNLEKLKLCVGSVRGQVADVEHVVQDALSSDGTAEWLSAQTDLRYESANDAGMYDAINRAWARCSGDVFSWLNSDEQYLPGTLQIVEKAFSENPKVDFIYGDALIVDAEGGLLAARREIRLSRLYISNSFLNAYSCTLFFRSELFNQGELRLDDQLRYAADMDLVLRLLRSSRSVLKLDKYLSAFTFDGTNLSCKQGMLDETRQVQRRHGGFSLAAMRRAVACGRYLEKLLSGCYSRKDIEYQRCIDETPHYTTIKQFSVPASYKTRR